MKRWDVNITYKDKKADRIRSTDWEFLCFYIMRLDPPPLRVEITEEKV